MPSSFFGGLKTLVVLCGSTYLQRLWCLIEIMIFLEMGGDGVRDNLDIKVIESGQRNSMETFDAEKARSFMDYDTARLQEVIKVMGSDRIRELVRVVFFGAAARHSLQA